MEETKMNRNDAIIEVMGGDSARQLGVPIFWLHGDDLYDEFADMDYLDVLIVGKESGKIDKNDDYFYFLNGKFETCSKQEVIEYFENELRDEIDEDDYQALCEEVEELMNEE